MSETTDGTPRERDRRLEGAILLEIVSRHPGHLTTDELVLRVADRSSGADRTAVGDRLQELKRDGLIRLNGEVVEPTHAAVRAAEIFGV